MASAGEFPIKEGNMLLLKVPLSLENVTRDTERQYRILMNGIKRNFS